MKIIEFGFLAIGGVLGTLLRYKLINVPFYLGSLQVNVLVVNVIGSFILGSFVILSQQWNLDGKYALLIAFGFCGSLTTMSAVAFDTHGFLSSAKYGLLALNAGLNLGCSVAAIFGGKTLFGMVFGQHAV